MIGPGSDKNMGQDKIHPSFDEEEQKEWKSVGQDKSI